MVEVMLANGFRDGRLTLQEAHHQRHALLSVSQN
jgi:hypothetical protein